MKPQFVLGPLSVRVDKENMKNGLENGILIQVWDQTQMVPRKAQASSDKS